jgi:hypothetical protein
MTDPKKDACEPADNKLGPTSKQSREAERQRVVEEYVIDLREILKKDRQAFQLEAAFHPQQKRGAGTTSGSLIHRVRIPDDDCAPRP